MTALTSTAQGIPGLSQSSDFLPVDEAYQLDVRLKDQSTLELNWRIADGYYLYQPQFAVSLQDTQGVLPSRIDFPPATSKFDEFFGDVEVYYNQALLQVTTDSPLEGNITIRVSSQGCADAGLCYPPNKQAFTLDTATGTVLPADAAKAPLPPRDQTDRDTADKSSLTWLSAILLAFAGGIILNAMPCVFPILSLKVLSFAHGGTQHRGTIWPYTLGVVLSFTAIASVLITLQQAGQAIGWGFQLQSTAFVTALAVLFTAMALSLSGVIEFGQGLMNVGNNLASQQGARGSFYTGVLAVVVASPCTAPFMGSALGFALTQPMAIALTVFAALGAGMAAPMVLLGYSSGLRKRLPKPGAWMETLKHALAFPLYLTVVWLLWVIGNQTNNHTVALVLTGLVMFALGLWLWRGTLLRRVFAGIALMLALAAVQGGLSLATGPQQERHTNTITWSDSALTKLRSQGVPVFVDVTADWCITCLANEKAVLNRPGIRSAFEEAGVAYMVADWTNYDEAIGQFVASHGRNGIPLYVMYPAGVNQEPVLLPQILTPSIVKAAIDQAISRQSP
jgi:thiol:disulfide interchange protein DsbD